MALRNWIALDELGENDVVCGKGNFDHSGNERFRHLVCLSAREYKNISGKGSAQKKRDIRIGIYYTIRDERQGRFVAQVSRSNFDSEGITGVPSHIDYVYKEIDQDAAMDKIAQTIRTASQQAIEEAEMLAASTQPPSETIPIDFEAEEQVEEETQANVDGGDDGPQIMQNEHVDEQHDTAQQLEGPTKQSPRLDEETSESQKASPASTKPSNSNNSYDYASDSEVPPPTKAGVTPVCCESFDEDGESDCSGSGVIQSTPVQLLLGIESDRNRWRFSMNSPYSPKTRKHRRISMDTPSVSPVSTKSFANLLTPVLQSDAIMILLSFIEDQVVLDNIALVSKASANAVRKFFVAKVVCSKPKIVARIFDFFNERDILCTLSMISTAWSDAATASHEKLMLLSMGFDSPADRVASLPRAEPSLVESVSQSLERPWDYFNIKYPWACYLGEGGYKIVFKVFNHFMGLYEALSVTNVVGSLNDKRLVAVELAVSAQLSSLVRRNICPNFVAMRRVFKCSVAPPSSHWGNEENQLPRGESYENADDERDSTEPMEPEEESDVTEYAAELLFDSLDKKKVGVLTMCQFKSFVKSLGESYGDEDFEEQKPRVDPEEIGKVTRSAFISWYVNFFRPEFLYTQMELCEHGDVEHYIAGLSSKVMSQYDAKCVLFQVAYALYVADTQFSMKHYDLKLLNVFLQDATQGDGIDVGLRYDLGKGHVYVLRTALLAKLGDYGTARFSSDDGPVTIAQFTTPENTPPEYMILGDNALQGHGHDNWNLGLCMLHLFTGEAPYEEILGDVECPPNLKNRLWKIWVEEQSGYKKLRSFIFLLGEDNPDETLFHTLYRYLVLFGIPEEEERTPAMLENKVWRAIFRAFDDPSSSKRTREQVEVEVDETDLVFTGRFAIGTKVWKNFDGQDYLGEVTSIDEKTGWYDVLYEDGDREECNEVELLVIASRYDSVTFNNNREKYSLSHGSDPSIKRARESLQAMKGGIELLLALVDFDHERRATALDVMNSSFMSSLREAPERVRSWRCEVS